MPRARRSSATSFTPPQVAAIYNFPPGLDGSGQTVALIELNDVDRQGNPTGTGYATSDVTAYFQSLGIPTPSVTAVGVDGGANMPGPDPNADGEVTLDIEVAGALRRGVRRGALEAARGTEALEDLSELAVVRYPHGPLLARIWALRDRLSAYDAAYVALAERLGAPLLTRDAPLARAGGHRARIELVE